METSNFSFVHVFDIGNPKSFKEKNKKHYTIGIIDGNVTLDMLVFLNKDKANKFYNQIENKINYYAEKYQIQ